MLLEINCESSQTNFFSKLPLQIWAICAIVGSREGPGYPTISINGYCKCNFRSWVTIVSAICSCDLSYYGGFENLSNFHKICSPGNGKHLRLYQIRAEPVWSAIHTRLRERGWLSISRTYFIRGQLFLKQLQAWCGSKFLLVTCESSSLNYFS